MASAANPTAGSFARRPVHAGARRSGAQTALFTALAVTGLWIWLRPGDGAVVLAHVAAGVLLTVLLAGWLWRHVPKGLAQSKRRAFTQTSWVLLASWLIVTVSGLVMAVPMALWLLGMVWFPGAGVTSALSILHLWSTFIAAAGLILHLGQRHWAEARR